MMEMEMFFEALNLLVFEEIFISIKSLLILRNEICWYSYYELTVSIHVCSVQITVSQFIKTKWGAQFVI